MYSFNKLLRDASLATRDDPQIDIYIALAVLRYVPYNTKDAIKNEIKSIVSNVDSVTSKSTLETNSFNELQQLMQETFNNFGSKEEINKNTKLTSSYKVLADIAVAIEFIEKNTHSSGRTQNKLKTDIFNLISHFDTVNIVKVDNASRELISKDKQKYRENDVKNLIKTYNNLNKTNTKIQKNTPVQQAKQTAPTPKPPVQQAKQTTPTPKPPVQQVKQTVPTPKPPVQQVKQTVPTPKPPVKQVKQTVPTPKQPVQQAKQTTPTPQQPVQQAKQTTPPPKQQVQQDLKNKGEEDSDIKRFLKKAAEASIGKEDVFEIISIKIKEYKESTRNYISKKLNKFKK